jgi:hypothetical protein
MADRNGRRAGDFALLDGETREWSAADAEHWARVYRELIRFCRQLASEPGMPDGDGIRPRLAHLEARLAFWESEPLQKVDEASGRG